MHTSSCFRFIPERLLFLGPDLAAAHFLVHRDAAVKFVGDDAWYKKDKKVASLLRLASDEQGNYSLPGVKVPALYIEAIDASNTELMYEGLSHWCLYSCLGFDNLYDLSKVRMLRMAGCEYMNDWTLAR